ncbi:OsmC family peroxiredoxin [Qipengyuania sp. JC766]|uniref:OsmC family peroxiredoxin n=1 Tax=Qipengyuania sp. JC766 TaxID=3232139 RepID=UPI00345ABE04
MATTNTGSATYQGLGKAGKGHISTGSAALSALPYGFGSRFEKDTGTNPEELIAAAHAACFTMALSFQLADAGFEDGTLTTSSTVTLEKDDNGFTVTKSELSTKGKVPGMEQAKFEQLAEHAKANCPISKLLNCEISLRTVFEG